MSIYKGNTEMERKATVNRKTKETDIRLHLDLDGKGMYQIDTGIPFIDHMLNLMAAHGFMDVKISAKGDTEIDYHHTIEDIGIDYRLSFNGEKLVPGKDYESPDLHLKGTLYNYMLLASRREDADTLFFSRRLHMQGDTELGLHVKNFLDGLDMESQRIPAMLEAITRKSLPWYERLFG